MESESIIWAILPVLLILAWLYVLGSYWVSCRITSDKDEHHIGK